MEKFMCESLDENDEDLQILGFALFLLHCRARYSDAARPEHEPTLDLAPDGSGFVQATTKVTKTMKAKVFQNKAFELVGFAGGLTGLPWAKAWLDSRRKAGLDVAMQMVLNPLRREDSSWSKRSMTSQQFSLSLRRIMTSRGMVVPEPFGSHCCKVTLLSWAAKFGIPMHHRALLGGH
eukprot:5684214-Amphidinium_carterae.1